jgi:alpha-1,2-mannosyltransferase
MSIWKWLNPKRLRDYPRLVFIASWVVLLLNVIFRQGWTGGLTGIMIGGDFISNYSGGVIYKTDISHLYDPEYQQLNQAELIAPYHSQGFAPFISPPYVGLAMSWIANLPLSFAFVAWEIINLCCVALSAYLISKYLLPSFVPRNDLPPYQLLILVLSTFACVDGFIAGQSHGIILLLCTGILLAMMKEKWVIAGVLGGVLIYKPQFVLGFVICWLIWRRFDAIISFVIFTLLWQIPIIVSNGLAPYLSYLQFTRMLLYLPYAKDSFPIAIMATPYAFLATLLPVSFAKAIQILLIFIGIGMAILVSWVAYRSKNLPVHKRVSSYALAIIFPLIIAPHTLIYDLLILVPVLVILVNYQERTQTLKLISIIFYLSLLIFPLVSFLLKVALPGLIPVAILVFVLMIYFRPKIQAELS